MMDLVEDDDGLLEMGIELIEEGNRGEDVRLESGT